MRDGSKTRLRIEAAALRLFVEKGVAETTIRDIAQGAGVAEGALYRHYAGKDDLVWGLFSRHFTDFAERLEALQVPAAGLRAKLAAMIEGFCRFFDGDPLLFRFLLLVQHNQLAKLTPDMANPTEVLARILGAAMARAEIPAGDVELATALVMGIVLQAATFCVYRRITGPMIALAPALAAAAWRALDGAPDSAPPPLPQPR